MFEIMPNLDNTKPTPLYSQLCQYIKQEIQNGTIKSEEKLPSKRKLAIFLGISQNTVKTAYEQLCAEGYAESKIRKGIFVTKLEEDLFISQSFKPKLNKSQVLEKDFEYRIDFALGRTDLESFPYDLWRKLTIQALYSDQSNLLLIGEAQGELGLREEISNYIFQSRGVRAVAEQIIIGAGTQFLMILLCMLIGKESKYAIENPGFHRTRHAFKDQGVEVVPIPIDEEGICIEELSRSLARVVYITPSHQFPSGMVMPISRRMELLKWCEERDGYIIEDDYDGEFRYKGSPIPSLQGLDTKGNVIYMGTFSKALIPSMRISYLVLPETLMKKYEEHYKIYKQTVSRLHQNTLYRFMKDGYWANHLNKMRTLYRKKQKKLLTSIDKHLGNKVQVIGAKSGLHVLLKVKNGMLEEALIEAARNLKVKVYPTSIYYAGHENNGGSAIILGFAGVKESEIDEGIKALKEAWFS